MPINGRVGDVMRAPRLPKVSSVVIVRWDDIQTDHAWLAPQTALGVAKCFTVGVVIAIDARTITLAACVGAGDSDASTEVNLRMCIPLGCVTSWSPLRAGREVKP